MTLTGGKTLTLPSGLGIVAPRASAAERGEGAVGHHAVPQLEVAEGSGGRPRGEVLGEPLHEGLLHRRSARALRLAHHTLHCVVYFRSLKEKYLLFIF